MISRRSFVKRTAAAGAAFVAVARLALPPPVAADGQPTPDMPEVDMRGARRGYYADQVWLEESSQPGRYTYRMVKLPNTTEYVSLRQANNLAEVQQAAQFYQDGLLTEWEFKTRFLGLEPLTPEWVTLPAGSEIAAISPPLNQFDQHDILNWPNVLAHRECASCGSLIVFGPELESSPRHLAQHVGAPNYTQLVDRFLVRTALDPTELQEHVLAYLEKLCYGHRATLPTADAQMDRSIPEGARCASCDELLDVRPSAEHIGSVVAHYATDATWPASQTVWRIDNYDLHRRGWRSYAREIAETCRKQARLGHYEQQRAAIMAEQFLQSRAGMEEIARLARECKNCYITEEQLRATWSLPNAAPLASSHSFQVELGFDEEHPQASDGDLLRPAGEMYTVYTKKGGVVGHGRT
jgi:hypothetical protein